MKKSLNFNGDNLIQNTEILIGDNHQYLKIHKNGCTFVQDCFKLNYPNSFKISFFTPHPDLPFWTVIRDPYQRFISGLTYDIELHRNNENLEELINNLDYKNLFLKKIHPKFRKTGLIPHTLLQFTYLFKFNLDFFVSIKDLSHFSKIHFPKISQFQNHSNIPSLKTQISDIIQNTPKIKQIVDNYLSTDYYIINELYSNNLVWNWQNGKMF